MKMFVRWDLFHLYLICNDVLVHYQNLMYFIKWQHIAAFCSSSITYSTKLLNLWIIDVYRLSFALLTQNKY